MSVKPKRTWSNEELARACKLASEIVEARMLKQALLTARKLLLRSPRRITANVGDGRYE